MQKTLIRLELEACVGHMRKPSHKKEKRHVFIGYFSTFGDKILTRSNAREEGFIDAYVGGCGLSWREHEVTGHDSTHS